MKRILIVDDDPSFREILETVIKGIHPDAVIVHAGHGVHAWNIISVKKRFDLVLSDVQMPEMDGVELTKKIKGKHPEIHIVLLSGRDEPKGHKADSFMGKPFTVEELEKKIKQFLEKGEQK